MIIASLYLNAVLCSDVKHTDCQAPQFMWTAPEGLPATVRVAECEVLKAELNKAQDDKSIFYRCDVTQGVARG